MYMGTKNYRHDRIIEAGLLFSLLYLPSFLFQSGAADPAAFNTPGYNIQLWSLLIPRILVVIYLISRDGLLGFRDFGLVRPSLKDLPWFLLAAAAAAGTVICLQMIFQLFPGMFPESDFQWKLTGGGMIPAVFLSSMLTGYSEELFFRSYLYRRLESLEAGTIRTVIAVNLLFSLGHVYEGAAGPLNAFSLGCVLSYFYLKKKNIHIPAIVHGLYNFTALLLTLFL